MRHFSSVCVTQMPHLLLSIVLGAEFVMKLEYVVGTSGMLRRKSPSSEDLMPEWQFHQLSDAFLLFLEEELAEIEDFVDDFDISNSVRP